MTNRKLNSAGMALMLLVSSFIFILASNSGSATATGDVYPGSGDWIITTTTVYTDETLTVYGNISILAGASLTLTNTDLTLDQDSDYNRGISVGGVSTSFLKIQSGSTVTTTNTTSGRPNAVINVAGHGYLHVDNSTVEHFYIWIINLASDSQRSHLSYSDLVACMVWNQYGFGYEMPDLDVGPLTINACNIRDVDVVHHAMPDTTSLISISNGAVITGCTFTNITLPSRAADYSSFIRVHSQNNFSIVDNVFEDTLYSPLYLRGWTTYWISDAHIDGNIFEGIGGLSEAESNAGACYLKDTATRTSFDDNVFYVIRNASKGVLVEGSGWVLDGNRFDNIDSTGLSGSGVTGGVWIMAPGKCTVDHTVINNIRGSGLDTGAAAHGVRTIDAGNVTVRYSVMRNISYVSAWGIAFVDSAVSPGLGNLLAHANTFYNMKEACGAIYWYSGTGGIASWNNISQVDGSATGVMFHDTKRPVLAHNNSVTGMYYADNIWPFWSISPAAYSVCAGTIWNASFVDNHAEGATAIHPAYDVNGEGLGGGWSEHMEATIDVSEPSIIRQVNSNVTLTHDTEVLQVLLDGISVQVTHYVNGSSYAWFEKEDLEVHWINVTPTHMLVNVSYQVDFTVSSWDVDGDAMLWTVDSGSDNVTLEYTVGGLEPDYWYDVYAGGHFIEQVKANDSGYVTFECEIDEGSTDFKMQVGAMQMMTTFLFAIVGIAITVMVIVGIVGVMGSVVSRSSQR